MSWHWLFSGDCHLSLLVSLLQDAYTSLPTFFAFNSLKALFCHRFIRRCSGRLEIMGKLAFCIVRSLAVVELEAVLKPQHCHVHLLYPTCLPMGYSTGVQVDLPCWLKHLFPQKSPGEKFDWALRCKEELSFVSSTISTRNISLTFKASGVMWFFSINFLLCMDWHRGRSWAISP